MIKILHILNTPRAEGTPRLVLDWLSVPGYHQEVFVLHRDPADLTAALKEASDGYQESNLLSYGKSKFPRIVRETQSVCRERQPDVVVIWVAGFANFISLGCRLAGVKKILAHAGNPSEAGLSASIRCNMVILPLALFGTQLVCCSDYVRDTIENVTFVRPKMHSVWNCTQGVAFAKRAAAARATRTVVPYKQGIMVATLEDHKDHATLLDAMKIVSHARSDFKMKLVGEGSLREQITSRLKSLQLEHCVELLGARKDVAELMGQSDLFVFSTTRQEGLGSVLLEAMAAELPIIASDVPACHEILQEGRRGILVRPQDAEALAQAILQWLDTAPNALSLEDHRHFSCELTPSKMLGTYLNLVNLPVANPEEEA